ncbi:F-box/kelch-repeat protein At3g23880-like [Lotus japonicus]|uniref:F-box/kelch-repeat protein At3g23880-like n=1 Tax=Lotus japonicus TaxID=34305 RepID=UPI00258A3BCB|nr:F-box/kelch-repeat protein At3g23880-like [Lotus japonicus]
MGLEILNYSSVFESLGNLLYYLYNLGRSRPPFLCQELLVEILSWLPVKSLVRFRCVSKSWKSLISDSRFVKLHLQRSSSRVNADFSHAHFLTLCDTHAFDRTYISSRCMSSLVDTHSTTAASPVCCLSGYDSIGACNGLVGLSYTYYVKRKRFFRVCFWNPATRLMSQRSPRLRSSGYFGFGYDCSCDTYKVVSVCPEETMVNVYNMGDDRWRRIQVVPLPRLRLMPPAVYVSNNINWLATLPIDILYGNHGADLMDADPYVIVSFDLGKQKYTQLSLPYCPRSMNDYWEFLPVLGVLRGCLCISENNDKIGNFEVWQMKEFGVQRSWTRLFSIHGYENFIQLPCFAMCISDNGDALLLSVSGASRGVLYTFRDKKSRGVLYTFRDKKFQGTEIANEIDGCYTENYIESLMCIKTNLFGFLNIVSDQIKRVYKVNKGCSYRYLRDGLKSSLERLRAPSKSDIVTAIAANDLPVADGLLSGFPT